MVLIDAANLESSLKDLKWHMDYKKLHNFFNCHSILKGIIFYTARFNNQEHDNFLTKLKKIGFRLVTKDVKVIYRNGRTIKKANFDVEISVDAINLADKYDTLVLFSGDSDFAYLLEDLKKRNKRVIVVSSRNHISKELIKCSNKYFELNKLRDKLQRVSLKEKARLFQRAVDDSI